MIVFLSKGALRNHTATKWEGQAPKVFAFQSSNSVHM